MSDQRRMYWPSASFGLLADCFDRTRSALDRPGPDFGLDFGLDHQTATDNAAAWRHGVHLGEASVTFASCSRLRRQTTVCISFNRPHGHGTACIGVGINHGLIIVITLLLAHGINCKTISLY